MNTEEYVTDMNGWMDGWIRGGRQARREECGLHAQRVLPL